jgi:hypothetical protein
MSLPSARITSKAAPELGYVAELERLPQVLDEGLEVLSVLPRHLQRIGHINYLSGGSSTYAPISGTKEARGRISEATRGRGRQYPIFVTLVAAFRS